ncbi:MAG: sulfatase-like hydrolase/transferase [Bacteroidia bacterium]
MKKIFQLNKIPYIARLILFWMLFFAFYRLVFIVYHHTRIPDYQSAQTGLAFLHALRLDLSTACAATFIPYILWVVQQFYKKRFIHLSNLFFNLFCITLLSILSIANLKIYGEWGTLLGARAFNYIFYPQEILSFISVWAVLLMLMVCAVFIFFLIKCYRTYINNFSYPIQNNKLKIVTVVVTPVLLIIGYRGGLQLSPINESSSYYSTLQINNHIATNNIWYLAHSLVEANDSDNPYLFMANEQAIKRSTDLKYNTSQKKELLSKTNKPNIVFIVLESWTADIIQALGAEPNITPHFNQLSKEGLLFTQMYGSGFRTEQGLVSLLSGFPAQPNNTIIATPSKAEQLPSLNKILVKNGYQSSLYYGGEVEFANMKSYFINNNFAKIIDKKDFDEKQLNSKWGAHDEHVFNKQLQELKTEKEPFFSVVLTLSTHEPFEVPLSTPFTGATIEERFKAAAYYTDNCLFNYFNQAKQQPWYKNTLFVLVADHGHHLPQNRNMDLPESRRIAAMIIGPALTDSLKGKTYKKIVSQHDLPATILNALNLPDSSFYWSRDIFNNNSKEFAYYSNENALGWITPEQNISYFFNSKEVIVQPKTQATLNDSILTDAKAYLQTLYQQYLNY